MQDKLAGYDEDKQNYINEIHNEFSKQICEVESEKKIYEDELVVSYARLESEKEKYATDIAKNLQEITLLKQNVSESE